jgi:hypothetical protein
LRIAELVVAGVCACLGVRSLAHWTRRPFEGRTAGGHALFALHVTARAGAWFAIAALFFLYSTVATVDPITGQRIVAEGRAFTDAAKRYSWFFVVLLSLGALQFVSGWFLGRNGSSSVR